MNVYGKFALKWVNFWRGLKAYHLMGWIELAYALAIIGRSDAGPAGYIERQFGVSGLFMAGALLACAIPSIVKRRLNYLWFYIFETPLVIYNLAAMGWALESSTQPFTAIAANGSVLVLLAVLNSRVAWEGQNGRDH
jgi:hypothetical protein